MFYAAPTSVYGEESQGLILRILTIIELYEIADYYPNHPRLIDADREGIFEQGNNTFSNSVSFESQTKFHPTKDNKGEVIQQEAILMCTENMHLMCA